MTDHNGTAVCHLCDRPWKQPTYGTTEVIEATEQLEAKLPHHPPTGNNWGTVSDRLDETMRKRLLDFGKEVI